MSKEKRDRSYLFPITFGLLLLSFLVMTEMNKSHKENQYIYKQEILAEEYNKNSFSYYKEKKVEQLINEFDLKIKMKQSGLILIEDGLSENYTRRSEIENINETDVYKSQYIDSNKNLYEERIYTQNSNKDFIITVGHKDGKNYLIKFSGSIQFDELNDYIKKQWKESEKETAKNKSFYMKKDDKEMLLIVAEHDINKANVFYKNTKITKKNISKFYDNKDLKVESIVITMLFILSSILAAYSMFSERFLNKYKFKRHIFPPLKLSKEKKNIASEVSKIIESHKKQSKANMNTKNKEKTNVNIVND